MTKEETTDCVKVLRLLDYVGCNDIPTAFEKVHYWSFVTSLSNSYEKYRKLTDKQKDALQNLLRKHVGSTFVDTTAILHMTQYSRKGKTARGTYGRVEHDFDELNTIQLFDLPFDSDSIVTLEIHPYNSHNVVVMLDKLWYKIPKPAQWLDINDVISKTCKYKRTEYKGYLEEIVE